MMIAAILSTIGWIKAQAAIAIDVQNGDVKIVFAAALEAFDLARLLKIVINA